MKGTKICKYKVDADSVDERRYQKIVRDVLADAAVDPLSFLEGEISVGLQPPRSDFEPLLKIRSIADAVIEANDYEGNTDKTVVLSAGIEWLLREALKLQQEVSRIDAIRVSDGATASKPEVARGAA